MSTVLALDSKIETTYKPQRQYSLGIVRGPSPVFKTFLVFIKIFFYSRFLPKCKNPNALEDTKMNTLLKCWNRPCIEDMQLSIDAWVSKNTEGENVKWHVGIGHELKYMYWWLMKTRKKISMLHILWILNHPFIFYRFKMVYQTASNISSIWYTGRPRYCYQLPVL